MLSDKRYLVLLILLILLCVVFYPVIFNGKIFGSPDTLNPKAATIILNETQKQIGEYPLWQPWIFSGMPTAESFTNISNLYFLQHIFKLLRIPSIIIHLLHFFLAGLGVFILLRYLKLSQYVAIAGAAGFMLMPYLVTMEVFGHGSQIMTAAYIPWAFWIVLRLLDKQRILDTGFLALILGLQLQRAHVQIAYYTWMLIGALFLYKVFFLVKDKNLRKNALKGTILFTVSLVLAIGIAALVYLPSLQYSSESIRSVGQPGSASYEYATSWSFHPKEMLTFLIPSAYGFGGQTYWGKMPFTDFPNYMGIIFLVLSIIAIVKRRDRLVWFIAGTTVLALLISFGKHFPLIYNLFYELAPYFDKFRIPSMILILVQFNTIILASIGLEELTKLQWKQIPKWFWWIVGLVGLFVLVLLFGGNWLRAIVSNGFTQPRSQDPRLVELINNLRFKFWLQDAWLMLVFIGGLLSSIFLFFREKISKTAFVVIISTIAIIDIMIVDYKIVQPAENSGRSSQLIGSNALKRYFQHDKITQYLTEQDGDFRIYPVGRLFGESRLQAFGIESVGGYHPAKLGIYSRFLSETNNISTLPLMRMMNIHYILSSQIINHPELELVLTDKIQTSAGKIPAWLYDLSDSLPRAWFVEQINTIGEDELWQQLVSDTFDPTKIAYINSENPLKIINVGSITEYESNVNNIKFKTNSMFDGFVVISEVHYPLRWKANIDGNPTDTFKTNGIIRGIIVPAGEHLIEFNYDKSVFNTGIILSLISTIIAVGIIGFGILKDKKHELV